MEGQAPTIKEITAHLVSAGFTQRSKSLFVWGPIVVKLVDEIYLRVSIFDKETGFDLYAILDTKDVLLFKDQDD